MSHLCPHKLSQVERAEIVASFFLLPLLLWNGTGAEGGVRVHAAKPGTADQCNVYIRAFIREGLDCTPPKWGY